MIEQISNLAAGAFGALSAETVRLLPRILVAVALLGVGIVGAFLGQWLVRGLLRRTGIDQLAARTGVGRVLTRLEYTSPVSHLFGFVAFWIVLAIFLITSADVAGLPTLSRLVGDFIAHLPPYILATVLLLVGLSLARLVKRTVEGVAERSRLVAARPLGMAAYWLIVSLTVVVALSGLGPDFTILTAVTVALLTCLGLGAAGLLVTGSRDVARNTVSGVYARRSLRVGQQVRVGDITGTIAAVGQVNFTLRDGGRTWLVPYDHVVNSVVEVLDARASSGATRPPDAGA